MKIVRTGSGAGQKGFFMSDRPPDSNAASTDSRRRARRRNVEANRYRSERLNSVRVTPEELASLKEIATERGLGVSVLVRRSLFEGKLPPTIPASTSRYGPGLDLSPVI
jgi:hypothetical protein